MRLSANEVKRRVVYAVWLRTKDLPVDHYTLLEIMFDLIEEREKYRDRRA